MFKLASSLDSFHAFVAPVSAETVLGEIKAANLRGQLFPDPVDPARLQALDELAADLRIDAVGPTSASLGGWHALEE
jgi:hypothetical protein